MMKTRSTSRSRPSSKLWALCIALLLAPVAAVAQQSAVLTIELDRLFVETDIGIEIRTRLEQRAREIQAENVEIERRLSAEEQVLTEQRPNLPPDEFRALADAFHARVELLRAEQDDKERQFNRQNTEVQAEFIQQVRPILADIMLEKGAVVIVDQRDIFLSDARVDITDEAIERINANGVGSE